MVHSQPLGHSARTLRGMKIALMGIVVNAGLAFIKIFTGILGHSYALIADGVESTLDIFSSALVWSGHRIGGIPPDKNHPYGHGKAESIAAMGAAFLLIAAAVGLAIQSVREILIPHHSPAVYTLIVLVVVVVSKEVLFRFILKVSEEINSTSLKVDAWHHRSDAMTSLAAFVGIAVALMGGKGFESADDWAALFACGIIAVNGVRLFSGAVGEIMDAAPSAAVIRNVRKIAAEVPGVEAIEKCRLRKSGVGFLVDIHVEVDGNLSVDVGHKIGHDVKDRLLSAQVGVIDALVHIEPVKKLHRRK